MTEPANPNPVLVVQDWLQSNRQQFNDAGVVASFRSTPGQAKGVAEFEKEGCFLALVEVWQAGDIDFTVLDLRSPKQTSGFRHIRALTDAEMRIFLTECNKELTGEW
jgi:hypothetical protein